MRNSIGYNLADRARQYSTHKYILAIANTVYLLILLLAFAGSGLSRILEQIISVFAHSRYQLIPLYLLAIGLLYYLLDAPFNLYQSYILEHKFNLSRQKISDWFKDQLKEGLISYVICLILISAFYYILAHNPGSWWLIISLFWIFLSLILAKLTPVIIIPLFFKYRKLSDETLRERIMALAEKMKVKLLDCFEIDFSRKTVKANAAFAGWGKTRRVILADTLKDKYSYEEIEVILAHEFAHYRLGHIFKLILANALATVIIFYVIFITNIYVLALFDLSSLSDISALPVVLAYFVIFGIVMQPFQNYISRKFERDADRMALDVTGMKEAFISMMDKLASQNLADRNPHPLVKFFFFDHPPVAERIAMAKEAQ